MRILLSAYSCMPGEGSEPGVGWNWAYTLDQHGYRVTVITRAIHREKLTRYLQEHPELNIEFLFCDLPLLFQRCYKLPFGNYTYHWFWQRRAARVALAAHQKTPFDMVQHITWCTIRIPSRMGILGIPFIFGPVAGGEDIPAQLRGGLGFPGHPWELLRQLTGMLTTVWTRSTYRAASTIAVCNEQTLSKIPPAFRHKTLVEPSIGIDLASLPSNPPPQRTGGPLQVLYVGRLLPWKGVHLLLRAMARVDPAVAPIELTLIGTGSDRGRLEALARQLGIAERLHWVGTLPREEVLRAYTSHDLFAFPSLHDSGGVAVLEAMSAALPVLCLGLGGPGTLVKNSCGRVVPALDAREEDVIGGLAAGLLEMALHPERRAELGLAARKRVSELTWDAHVRAIYGTPAAAIALGEGDLATV
jgi:glycosyltransferase involved in cell wall biosynthesis